MNNIETGMTEVVRKSLVFLAPSPMCNQAREPSQHLGIKTERFATFARGTLSSVRDDVVSHRRAQLAVSHTPGRLYFSSARSSSVEIDFDYGDQDGVKTYKGSAPVGTNSG